MRSTLLIVGMLAAILGLLVVWYTPRRVATREGFAPMSGETTGSYVVATYDSKRALVPIVPSSVYMDPVTGNVVYESSDKTACQIATRAGAAYVCTASTPPLNSVKALKVTEAAAATEWQFPSAAAPTSKVFVYPHESRTFYVACALSSTEASKWTVVSQAMLIDNHAYVFSFTTPQAPPVAQQATTWNYSNVNAFNNSSSVTEKWYFTLNESSQKTPIQLTQLTPYIKFDPTNGNLVMQPDAPASTTVNSVVMPRLQANSVSMDGGRLMVVLRSGVIEVMSSDSDATAKASRWATSMSTVGTPTFDVQLNAQEGAVALLFAYESIALVVVLRTEAATYRPYAISMGVRDKKTMVFQASKKDDADEHNHDDHHDHGDHGDHGDHDHGDYYDSRKLDSSGFLDKIIAALLNSTRVTRDARGYTLKDSETYWKHWHKSGYEDHKDGDKKDGDKKDGDKKDGDKKDGDKKDGDKKDGDKKDGDHGDKKDGDKKDWDHGDKKDDDFQFDRDGYDKYGFDKFGYDRHGYDRNGYDKYGYNKSGYDTRNNNTQYYRQYGTVDYKTHERDNGKTATAAPAAAPAATPWFLDSLQRQTAVIANLGQSSSAANPGSLATLPPPIPPDPRTVVSRIAGDSSRTADPAPQVVPPRTGDAASQVMPPRTGDGASSRTADPAPPRYGPYDPRIRDTDTRAAPQTRRPMPITADVSWASASRLM